MIKRILYCLTVIALLVPCAFSDKTFPSKDWKEQPNPLVSPDAEPGGTLIAHGHQYPKSLNYYLDNNYLVSQVFGVIYEGLLTDNPVSMNYEPWMASRWVISDDGLDYTFHLNPKAKWSDGKPITAHDVKWTFDIVMDPKSLTGPFKVHLGRFDSPTIIDDMTIRFHARMEHWENLGALGSFPILPKHEFEKTDFNKINFEFPVVSGPYKIGELKEGFSLSLKKNENWWAKDSVRVKGMFNIDTLKFRFFGGQDDAYAAFKKGEIDMFAVYTSHRWMSQTEGERFDKSWILKQKIFNYKAQGFQGFVMNMRRPPFDDVRVRKAVAHLVNRPKMNERLMFNQYFLHRSYYEDLYTKDNPCSNELIPFDPKAAQKLLDEAGWKVNPETGVREKEGKALTFSFLTRDANANKFLSIFKEDLKDAGVDLTIEQKDWAAWTKDMDGHNFNMTWAAWSAPVRKNPESMWHSSEATRKSGNNYAGFISDKVDQLIEKQRTIYDIEKRHGICRQIDQILSDEVPYALLWHISYVRLLYWNKFGMPDTVLSKYGNEFSAYWYWYVDPDAKEDLKNAKEKGLSLPAAPAEIHFDQEFRK